jgi:pyridoxine 5-phosphate synthase
MIEKYRPAQATLVPDPPHVLTSNAGWDTNKHEDLLKELVKQFREWGVRSSIFVDTNIENIEYAAKTGVDRIELYTGPYAEEFYLNKEKAIQPFIEAANLAHALKMGVNAGHDLNQDNLRYFKENIPFLAEVSIGHALISDALYLGMENTVQRYNYLLR